eukprot:CAMPEP_0174289904 /NCGR_PEP_ID=MMETSP0809-20121228/26806_1 /TAXON_ID=73025 ORGANISM="Eutreptiella gymnastica-like, Strain CCMP1594" /NCGR_SAMPLE_ID=MMETSP0809 /ASSEMBLY_ACC=CAM_ASM_000658 /LENGTH=198 /DNA_ID=CAMNT_0015388185 /DNA_START=16 /DNA_END=612 /DNA_ORIENTATION=+
MHADQMTYNQTGAPMAQDSGIRSLGSAFANSIDNWGASLTQRVHDSYDQRMMTATPAMAPQHMNPTYLGAAHSLQTGTGGVARGANKVAGCIDGAAQHVGGLFAPNGHSGAMGMVADGLQAYSDVCSAASRQAHSLAAVTTDRHCSYVGHTRGPDAAQFWGHIGQSAQNTVTGGFEAHHCMHPTSGLAKGIARGFFRQ